MLLLLGFAQAGQAASPLPEPLTLEYALSLADEMDPGTLSVAADVDAAYADLLEADSINDTQIDLQARLRIVEPVSTAEQEDDHRLALTLSRRLYDFGYSGASQDSAQSRVDSFEWAMIVARSQQRIRIMRRYFDVLLADLEYVRDNEAMATSYLDFDRARDRRDLGQASDVEVFELQSLYEESRHRRMLSEGRQRSTRTALAIVLNRPQQLSSVLAMPELSAFDRPLPDLDVLTEEILTSSPEILAKQSALTAAQDRVRAEKSSSGTILSGDAEIATYSRKTANRDRWRVGVTLDVPILDGDQTSARIARARAEVYRSRAELIELQNRLRQTVLDIWLEIDALKVQLEGLQARYDYLDLNLDRNRALYELEVKSDLGDAMVQVSNYRLDDAKARFKLALLWSRLDALLPTSMTESKEASQ